MFSRVITRGDKQYRIDARLEEVGTKIGIDFVAGCRKKAQEGWGEWEKITLKGEIDLKENCIRIFDGDRKIAEISLDTEVPESEDLDENDVDIEQENTTIGELISDSFEDAYGSDPAELIIQGIPVDPFLGCLIKSCISTVTGETIRCLNKIKKEFENIREQWREVAGILADCLKKRGKKMLWSFCVRTGICIVTFGTI